MRAKEYPLLSNCVENGIKLGWNRAFKHTDEPGTDLIHRKIYEAILEEILECFELDDWKRDED